MVKTEKVLKSLHKHNLISVIKPQTLLIIIVASIVDFSSLFMIFTNILLQHVWFLWILSGAIGLLLSFTPIMWVYLYKQRHYRLQHVHTVLLVTLPAFVIAFVGMLFWLRFATRDLEFAANQSSIVLAGQALQQEAISNPAALPMAVLLCAVPLFTVLINTFVAWIFENPVRDRLHRLEFAQNALVTEISELNAVIAEYTADSNYKQRLLDEEMAKYEAVIGEIGARADFYKTYVRIRIAEKLREPASTSALSKDNLIELRRESA